MKLIIFDLDQTLVNFKTIRKRVIKETFQKFFGIKGKLVTFDFTGQGLVDAFKELAELNNVPEHLALDSTKRLLQDYERIFTDSLPDNSSKYVLPGVKNILDVLNTTDNIVVLYTENSEKIVERILSITGLIKYFKFKFFGTNVKKRSDMVELAILEVEKLTGQKLEGKNIIVVGDSFRDIESGKRFGALTIALGTGPHSKTKLLEYAPDFYFDTMKEYKLILKAMSL
jgi:phosphoglycolate phosphatase-like HAD superfamily hydrolase